MKLNKTGITRIVIETNNHVIKIPNFTYSHINFLNGMYSNWSERHYSKMMKKLPEFYSLISPTIFSMYFGLLSIQKKATILKRDLTDDEIEKFKDVCSDIKADNFGYLNGVLVCVDYP